MPKKPDPPVDTTFPGIRRPGPYKKRGGSLNWVPIGRLVIVEWEDADEKGGWRDSDEVLADADGADVTIVCSVGYVVRHTDERLTIVGAVTRDGVGSQHRIPNGMIRSMRHLIVGPEAIFE